jgi:hypothetical protein
LVDIKKYPNGSASSCKEKRSGDAYLHKSNFPRNMGIKKSVLRRNAVGTDLRDLKTSDGGTFDGTFVLPESSGLHPGAIPSFQHRGVGSKKQPHSNMAGNQFNFEGKQGFCQRKSISKPFY